MLRAAQWSLVAGFLLFPAAFALGNTAILLAFLLSLAAGACHKRWNAIRMMPAIWWALGLYAMVLLGALYTSAPAADIKLHLSKYSKLLLVPVLLPLLIEQPWRQRCMDAYMVAMGGVLLSVYGNVFWQLPWSSTQNQGWGVDHTVVGDYITQNIMMVFFTLVAITRAQASLIPRVRWFWWLCALLASLAVTQLSNGRTGYVLLLVAIAIYIFTALQGQRRWLTLGALVSAVTIAVLSSPAARARIEAGIFQASHSDSLKTTSVGGRITFWKNTLQLALEKPLEGWGTGSYHTVWCQRVTAEGWCQYGGWHPHNQYLFFWMENGLLALLLFTLLVFAPAWASKHAARKDLPLLWSFTGIFAINSLVNSPLFSGRESLFFILMLILLCAQARFGAREPVYQPASGGPPASNT